MAPKFKRPGASLGDCGEDCVCPSLVDDDDALIGVVPYLKAKCFTWQQLFINTVLALQDIAAAIREYISSQPVVIATGVMHFRLEDYGNLTNGNCVDVELFLSGLELEIVGITASYIPPAFVPQGVYSNDDQLRVKLFNETTNVQIGNSLLLTNTQKHDSQTNGGDVVGQNVAVGNTVMARICYTDSEGSTMPATPLDLFIYIRPTALQTEV